MASLAGISANVETKPDHILISIDSYNDNIENFVQAFFSSLQSFQPDETFFENKKDEQLSLIINSLYAEPYARVGKFLNCALVGGDADAYRQLEILDEMSFDNFVQMKSKWLKSISFTWLIQGHLTQE